MKTMLSSNAGRTGGDQALIQPLPGLPERRPNRPPVRGFIRGIFRSSSAAVLVLSLVGTVVQQAAAKPIDSAQAKSAASAYLAVHNPAAQAAPPPDTAPIPVDDRVATTVQPLLAGNQVVGYLSALQPSGFVLIRADDEAPPVKLHAPTGTFQQLPPEFQDVAGRLDRGAHSRV